MNVECYNNRRKGATHSYETNGGVYIFIEDDTERPGSAYWCGGDSPILQPDNPLSENTLCMLSKFTFWRDKPGVFLLLDGKKYNMGFSYNEKTYDARIEKAILK